MKKKIVFNGMDKSDVMENYINGQLAKIESFLENEKSPIFIDVILEPSKMREHHRVELRIKTPTYDMVSNYEHEGMNFYDVIDRVIDVMYNRLLEEKQRVKRDKRKMTGRHDDFKKQR